MNILFLANLIPYPLDNGGKIFTSSIIQALSKDNNIDLVCFYEHEDIIKGKDILGKYCSSIECLPIKVTTQENIPEVCALKLGTIDECDQNLQTVPKRHIFQDPAFSWLLDK